MSLKGVNWGKLSIGEETMVLHTVGGGHSIFGLDYKTISTSTVNKNDITIETATEDLNNDDLMCEIRFHVECVKEEQEQKQKQSGESQENQEGEGATKKFNKVAQAMHKEIVERAKIGEFAGESIASLSEVNLMVPRGKYSVDFYQKNMRFHGITYSYNINYKNILKGFILPMANQAQISFILQLNKPIYQGQTVYPYIVIQIKKETEVELKTKLKPEHEKIPHLAKIKPEYNGPLYEVFGDLIRTAGEIQLISPGNEFKSKSGQSCIKCGVKAQSGWLYFLKKSMMFIPKPIIYFRTEDISKVEFLRMGSSNKQFDMKITLSSEKKNIEYNGIERPEKEALLEYFKNRNIKVIMEETASLPIPAFDDDDESDDQDFDGNARSSSSSDESGSSDAEESSKSKQKSKEASEKKPEE